MGNKNTSPGPLEPGTLGRGAKGGRKTLGRKLGTSSPASSPSPIPKSYVDVVPLPETPGK